MIVGSNRDVIMERLRALANQRLGIDASKIKEGTRLADLGIDSFAIIELVFSVEEEFGIRIPLDGVIVATIDDVVAVVLDRLDSAGANEAKRG